MELESLWSRDLSRMKLVALFIIFSFHQDMPIIRQRAFHVAPGTENQIPVTPTLYTTAPQVS